MPKLVLVEGTGIPCVNLKPFLRLLLQHIGKLSQVFLSSDYFFWSPFKNDVTYLQE